MCELNIPLVRPPDVLGDLLKTVRNVAAGSPRCPRCRGRLKIRAGFSYCRRCSTRYAHGELVA
jgi:tRNA(Ile2) C34 agmatinyltransferase TiaS